MKSVGIRNVFFSAMFAMLSPWLFSQTTYKTSDVLSNDVNWVNVTGIPEPILESAGLAGYRFHVNDSGVLELFAEKKNRLTQVASYEQCSFNPYKAEKVVYNKGDVTLCSELSYKATTVCCLFDFTKDTPEFVRLMTSDKDGDFLFSGDSLLMVGEIEKAVKAYELISKPTQYMDVVGKGVEILETAHPLALEAAKRQDYKKAVAVMESALKYKSLWVLDANEFESLAQLEKYQKEIWKYNRTIKDLLESYIIDYSNWLFLSGKVSQSVSYSSYLAIMLPDNPMPCLHWGNGLYKMGQYELAKQSYKMYIQRMEKWGEEQNVPEYVRERSK